MKKITWKSVGQMKLDNLKDEKLRLTSFSLVVYALLSIMAVGCNKDVPRQPDPVSKDITADFDPYFARVLEEKSYIPDAAHIMLADVQDIEVIDVSGTSSNPGTLASLKGIEHFESLKTLYCNSNPLTSLNISSNTQLKELLCGDNQLTSLDVSSNTLLKKLLCNGNQLTSLDVSKNTALEGLSCAYNPLSSLDISSNTQLKRLVCSSNQLTSLDISKNTALEGLSCHCNPGNGSGVFPVTTWFGNDAVPADFTTGSWDYNGQPVTINYRKAE